jgi:hypothetical protein
VGVEKEGRMLFAANTSKLQELVVDTHLYQYKKGQKGAEPSNPGRLTNIERCRSLPSSAIKHCPTDDSNR